MKNTALRTIAIRLTVSLGVLGVASALPAAASTLNLNTGNGADPYSITADTLSPGEGTTATVVTTLPGSWLNNLGSEWISPTANQNNESPSDAGYVTYQTTFSLPTNLNAGSTISVTFAADDWITATLDGDTFYTGPSGCNDLTGVCSSNPTSWTSDTVLTIPSAVDSLLASGTNTLTFTVWNTGGSGDAGGGPTGLDAQVAVNYTTSPSGIPEPPTALTLASALAMGLGFWRLRAGGMVGQTAS